jgi:type IV pilus assembly protein PilC
VGIPLGFLQWFKTPDGRSTIERSLIQVALLGDLIQKAAVAKVSRTLSTLLASGVDLLEALDIASKTAGNIVIEEALLKAKESLVGGKSLSSVLAKEKYIPEMVAQMSAIGEKSGTLDTMMGKIADFYEDEVENAVKALTTLIEPLLMVGLGGAIAFLMIAMYLPVFNIGNVVGN